MGFELPRSVRRSVPEEYRASEADMEKNQFSLTKMPSVMMINSCFCIHRLPKDFEYKKRNVLKRTAALFDTPGFLSPFVVSTKLFMQKAWLDQHCSGTMPFCPGRTKSGGIGSGSYPSSERSRFCSVLKI